MVSISYSGAEIYSIVIASKYCQSYTDPGLNGAENFCVEESGSSGSRRNAYWPSVKVSGLYEC